MTSKVTYISDFRCEAEHLQSGSKITTDAPADNHGKGEKFSPTDLCATSLAECALTTIAILGRDKNIVIDGATCELEKLCSATRAESGRLSATSSFPGHILRKKKNLSKTLRNTARCPKVCIPT